MKRLRQEAVKLLIYNDAVAIYETDSKQENNLLK